jgi:phosphatidylglycerophosphatase C
MSNGLQLPKNNGERKVVAIFDLDGTITKSDTYLAFLMGYVRRRPYLLLRFPVLIGAWTLYTLRLRTNSWLKIVFLRTIMGGVSHQILDQWANEFTEKLVNTGLRIQAIPIIESHRKVGHTLVLLTASFDVYVEKLAKHLGFEQVICTRAAWNLDDALSGDIEGKNCYGKEKVRRLAEHFRMERENIYIFGYTDHHSDLALMQWVDEPIVVNPTKRMMALAKMYSFQIENWDT